MTERHQANGVMFAERATVYDKANGSHASGFRASCSNCGRQSFIKSRPDAPRELLKKQLERAGWTVARSMKTANCPTCAAPAPKPEKEDPMPPKSAPTQTAKPQPTVQELRPIAPKERLRIMEALIEHMNDDCDRYEDGYDDKAMASMLGHPWGIIAKMREDSFGPLRELTEADKLREDIAALRAMVRDETKAMEERIAKLEAGK